MRTFPTEQNACGYLGNLPKRVETCPECGVDWYRKLNIGCVFGRYPRTVQGRRMVFLNKRGSTFFNDSAFK